jgi:hypothetical protein
MAEANEVPRFDRARIKVKQVKKMMTLRIEEIFLPSWRCSSMMAWISSRPRFGRFPGVVKSGGGGAVDTQS